MFLDLDILDVKNAVCDGFFGAFAVDEDEAGLALEAEVGVGGEDTVFDGGVGGADPGGLDRDEIGGAFVAFQGVVEDIVIVAVGDVKGIVGKSGSCVDLAFGADPIVFGFVDRDEGIFAFCAADAGGVEEKTSCEIGQVVDVPEHEIVELATSWLDFLADSVGIEISAFATEFAFLRICVGVERETIGIIRNRDAFVIIDFPVFEFESVAFFAFGAIIESGGFFAICDECARSN